MTPAPAVPPSSTTVSPNGGTASTSDGEISVVVPPGALSVPCKFEFTLISQHVPANPPTRVVASRVWDISAFDGAGNLITVFDKPIQIVFRYAAQATDLIGYWDGEEWVYLDSTPQPNAHQTIAASPHLSLVAVFAEMGPPAPGPTFPVVPVAIGFIALAAVTVATVAARRRAVPRQEP
ncbi:MAG: hypothetical protein JOY80_04320 [Candidatus Dormibacteraeota bacterium]|nr:hypothetical protein [Candidatus Dormibacteraeota bacterium]